jgi:hypothetical protein
MKFALHEVLSGMLATIEASSFPDDHERLARMFEGFAGRFVLFAPMATGVDPGAVAAAFGVLEQKQYLSHSQGQYTLSEEGRAHCVGSKRTLFNAHDREELEAAAQSFSEL